MKNYLEYFLGGGKSDQISEEYIVRVDNDNNKAGFIKGGPFIAYDKAKEGIKTLIDNIKKYVRIKKDLSNLYTPTSIFVNPAPNASLSIATKWELDNSDKIS